MSIKLDLGKADRLSCRLLPTERITRMVQFFPGPIRFRYLDLKWPFWSEHSSELENNPNQEMRKSPFARKAIPHADKDRVSSQGPWQLPPGYRTSYFGRRPFHDFGRFCGACQCASQEKAQPGIILPPASPAKSTIRWRKRLFSARPYDSIRATAI